MTPYTEDMNQEATYWAPTGQVEFGKQTFEQPVQIACRWQSKPVLFRTPQGEEKVSSAVVYVDRELAVQGWLVLGDFSDAGTEPEGIPGAMIILQTSASPDLGADETLHRVMI